MPYNQFVGLGEETAAGTLVARTRFAKLMEGSGLNHRADRQVSAKLSANVGGDAESVFDKGQWGEGKVIIPASFDDLFGLTLLKHGMGLYAVSGAGPFTHTLTRKVGPPFAAGAIPTAQALSLEMNYELPDASLQARVSQACRVKGFRLAWNAGEEFVIDADVIGKEAAQAAKSGAPTFPDYDAYEMKFAQVGVSIAGVQYASVISGLEISVDNMHETRFRLGSVFTQPPLRRGKAAITGAIRMDWEATPSAKTLWDLWKAKTSTEIIVTITGPTNYSLVATMSNSQFLSGDNSPEEGQLQSLELPFQALHHATNTALKLVVQNQSATV